jgi:AraC family transcriptional regulator
MVESSSILSALAFVEAHLQEPIAVADIADAAGYSLYYFCRIFNGATHHTPYSYLIRRRLAEAARALVTTDALVIDIAYDYQFNNPETFTRACRRVFGAPPSALREAGCLDPHRLMPPLTASYLTYLNANRQNLRPTFVERQPLQLTGLMTWSNSGDDAPVELWARLERTLAAYDALDASVRERYTVRWYPPDWARSGFGYLAAVAPLSAAPPAPAVVAGPLVDKHLPAGHYAAFRHAGEPDDLPLLLGYVYHTWLPNDDRTLAAPFVLEHHEPELTTLYFPMRLSETSA